MGIAAKRILEREGKYEHRISSSTANIIFLANIARMAMIAITAMIIGNVAVSKNDVCCAAANTVFILSLSF